MTMLMFLITFHVLFAVLGVGPIVAAARIAAAAASGKTPGDLAAVLVGRLLVWTSWAFAVMLVSGVAIEAIGGWAWHGAIWFRASGALLIAAGALVGIARGRLRKGHDLATLRGVAHLANGGCALVAVITVLMVTRPA